MENHRQSSHSDVSIDLQAWNVRASLKSSLEILDIEDRLLYRPAVLCGILDIGEQLLMLIPAMGIQRLRHCKSWKENEE
jgi:hypothetical protein